MVKLRLYFLVLLAILSLQIKAQLASLPKSFDFAISSEAQLSLLQLKERQVNNLYNYKEELVTQLKQVQLAIKHSGELLKSKSQYHNNVFFGFKVLRHLRSDWPKYLRLMKVELGVEEIALSQELLRLQPTAEDFTDSLRAIYRLQSVYELDPADMTEGVLDGRLYNYKLWSTDECIILGLMYLYQKNYDLAEYWLQLALDYYDNYTPKEQLKIKLWKYANLLEYLVEAHKGLGNYAEAKQYARELLSLEPKHEYMLRQLPKLKYLEKNPLNITEAEKDYQHENALCTKSYRQRSDYLFCYYVRWTPFLALAPIKMEQLSQEIYLSIIPDFISPKEIEILKNAARPNLQRIDDLSWNCSCKVAELSGTSNDVVRNINQRIMDITGYKMEKNQMLQVVNYGMAGNYNPDVTEKSANDHKANALIFLSNAEQGGHIVFDALHLTVKPRKGSLLMWLNPLKPGLHHQCPLLKGNMWLASKRLY